MSRKKTPIRKPAAEPAPESATPSQYDEQRARPDEPAVFEEPDYDEEELVESSPEDVAFSVEEARRRRRAPATGSTPQREGNPEESTATSADYFRADMQELEERLDDALTYAEDVAKKHPSRELSIFRTRLEEAYLWFGRAWELNR